MNKKFLKNFSNTEDWVLEEDYIINGSSIYNKKEEIRVIQRDDNGFIEIYQGGENVNITPLDAGFWTIEELCIKMGLINKHY